MIINDTDLLLVQSDEAIIYSDYTTAAGGWATVGNNGTNLFDGDENTYALAVGQQVNFDPPTQLSGTFSVKLWGSNRATFYYYDGDEAKIFDTAGVSSAAWTSPVTLSNVYRIVALGESLASGGMAAISVNGEILVDGVTTSQTETITFAQLKDGSVLNDSDRLLLNDGTSTSTVTWGEIKGELIPA